jgi:hypothetical protein
LRGKTFGDAITNAARTAGDDDYLFVGFYDYLLSLPKSTFGHNIYPIDFSHNLSFVILKGACD